MVLYWYRNEIDHRYNIPIVKRHIRAVCFKANTPQQKDYYIPPKDVARWLKAMTTRPDPVYYRLALLMIHSGLRLGEAAGICWDAVELGDNAIACIRIVRTLACNYQTKEPYFQDQVKTASSVRTVALGGFVLKMLRELKEPFVGKQTDPVFVNKKGRMLSDNSIRANFNAGFRAAGLKWSGTHITRHTFATLALMAEGQLASVQAALGHQSEKITAQYAKTIALQGAPLFQGVSN